MYLTKQLTLFKTPLSPTYENVYDDYSTYTDYENFLLNNFNHIEIDIVDDMEVGRDKSVIDKNGIFSLVVKNHSSMDIHDYNYCCFETDKNTSSPLFAFILSVDSLNDSRTSPSCRINCQLDAWTHNIFDMQSGYDVNYVECRHMIESENNNGTLYAIPHLTNEKQLAVSVENPVDEYILLWARITTGNEICALHLDNGTTKTTNCNGASAHKVSTTTPVFYLPLYVVNPLKGQINTAYKQALVKDKQSGQFSVVSRTMVDDNGNPIGLFCSGQEILSIELTYYAPYYYTLNNVTNTVDIYQECMFDFPVADIDYQEVVTLGDSQGRTLFTSTNFLGVPQNEIPRCCASPNTAYSILSNITVSKSLNKVLPVNPGSLNEYGFYDSLIVRLKNYPFDYESLFANGNEYTLLPSYERNLATYIIEKTKCVKPTFRFYFTHKDNQTRDYYDIISLEGNGQMVTTVDSLEYYMRNNGNKLLSMTLKNLFSFGSILSKTPLSASTDIGIANSIKRDKQDKFSSGIGFGSGIVDTIANISDAENAMDSYKNVNANALDNWFVQDFVYLKHYRAIKNIEYKELLRKLHDYGININQRLSVREKTHFTFDYVRTNNCRLPMIGNIDDRHEIETAYDRGITKWHISGNSTDAYMRTFSKNIPNMDLVQQEYYSVG